MEISTLDLIGFTSALFIIGILIFAIYQEKEIKKRKKAKKLKKE